jgi:hypothetical protein
VLGERLARRPAALKGAHRRGLPGCVGSPGLVLGSGRLEFFELQLELVDQPGATLGGLAVLRPAQLGDLELQRRDHRLRAGNHRPGLRQIHLGGVGAGLGRRERRAQSIDLGGGV